jgi:hypothetical protein
MIEVPSHFTTKALLALILGDKLDKGLSIGKGPS